MDEKLSILFTPVVMPNLTLKNRFFMAPMGTGYVLEKLKDYLVARARGGVPLITMADISVHPSGRPGVPNEPLLEKDDDIGPLIPVVKSVQNAGAKIVAQLNHVGRYAHSRVLGQQAVAPSAVASRYTGETPRALSTGEVEEMIQAFVDGAIRAQKAGFDGIELCGCSGYLISQFLSPLTNRRTDKYGGSLAKRMRFLTDILSETRKAVGPGLNICVKFDAEDGMEGGKTIEDSKQMAPEFVKAGADRLHIWAGWHESSRPMLPMFVPRASFSHLAREIKRVVDVPVATVGRINDPYIAAEILAEEKADMIGIGRALLCDPEFVNKTREGRSDEIRRCIGCCHCFDEMVRRLRSGDDSGLTCGQNPELGREGTEPIQKAEVPKHVLIIGAGPAGMEAARVAVLRGHQVDLYDQGERLGGLLNLAQLPPHKEELQNIIAYYNAQLPKLGVKLHFNSQVNMEVIRKIDPDITVLATGASSLVPEIEGIDQKGVITVADALEGRMPEGKEVVVIGGGMVGVETAEYLSDRGYQVAVIEMEKSIASDIGPTMRWGTVMRIKKKLKIFTLEKVVRIEEKTVVTHNEKGEEIRHPADTVVIAVGMSSDQKLSKQMQESSLPHINIGCCNRMGNIADAIYEGYEAGLNI